MEQTAKLDGPAVVHVCSDLDDINAVTTCIERRKTTTHKI